MCAVSDHYPLITVVGPPLKGLEIPRIDVTQRFRAGLISFGPPAAGLESQSPPTNNRH